MSEHAGRIARLSHFIHRNFLWLLLGSYVLAALFPGPGLFMREVRFAEVHVGQEHAQISLPTVMLALLLCNAGLGVQTRHLKSLWRNPWVLVAALLANLLVPILFIAGVAHTLRLWHNPDEVQQILVGLALVGSMPVAGSSTAWSQNSNGDMALSLGLVVFSTCLSPLTTPVLLRAVGSFTSGVYAEGLRELASGGTGLFLTFFVLLPSLVGMALRGLLGEPRLARIRPVLKLFNSCNLLLLCYSNAAVALPRAVAERDWDYLGVMLVIVVALCVVAFGTGWLLARLFRVDDTQRASLMFGLGMNNNGTGMVLAATALAYLPSIMLPVIFYNLLQHLVAGVVDRWLRRQEPDAVAETPATLPLPAGKPQTRTG